MYFSLEALEVEPTKHVCCECEYDWTGPCSWVTAEEGNPLMTFDTTDGAENVKAIKPLNAVDATDSCDTGTYGRCGNLASLTTAGGLTVGKKTFMTGASLFFRSRAYFF